MLIRALQQICLQCCDRSDLIIGENTESVQLDIRRKAWAVRVDRRDDTRHEGAMPQPVLQGGLVRPIGALSADVSHCSASHDAQRPACRRSFSLLEAM